MERQNYNSDSYVREESESEPFDQLLFFHSFLVFLLKKSRATFACNAAHILTIINLSKYIFGSPERGIFLKFRGKLSAADFSKV